MCVYYVLQIILFIMKNLSANFETREFSAYGIELLDNSEMQFVRGGVEVKPTSRPRDDFGREIGE